MVISDDNDRSYSREQRGLNSILDYDPKSLLAFLMVAGSAFVIIIWMPQYILMADWYAQYGYRPEQIVYIGGLMMVPLGVLQAIAAYGLYQRAPWGISSAFLFTILSLCASIIMVFISGLEGIWILMMSYSMGSVYLAIACVNIAALVLLAMESVRTNFEP
ncbi:MAG: hypothetical protein RTU30_15175 [Candidatus Thorarchaeota archaeon]